jgi:hypothetical protein
VSKEDADGEAGLPIEQVDRMDAGFYGGDFVVPGAEVLNLTARVRHVMPGDGLLGAESGLGDHLLGRIARDSRKIEGFQTNGVGGSEECPHVIEAADIFEQNGRWERANAGPARGGFSGTEGNSFVTQS